MVYIWIHADDWDDILDGLRKGQETLGTDDRSENQCDNIERFLGAVEQVDQDWITLKIGRYSDPAYVITIVKEDQDEV